MGNPFDRIDPEFLQWVRHHTRILRKPYAGIISGYHRLPYVLVGPDRDSESKSIEIRGRIHVSPKLVFTVNPEHPTLGELFENEIMNEKLTGRLFSFLYTSRYRNMNVQHEDLRISRQESPAREREETVLDQMMSSETIDTALIGCPNIEFYPVSLERFIQEILDREFK
jgi:hypothetical protein